MFEKVKTLFLLLLVETWGPRPGYGISWIHLIRVKLLVKENVGVLSEPFDPVKIRSYKLDDVIIVFIPVLILLILDESIIMTTASRVSFMHDYSI